VKFPLLKPIKMRTCKRCKKEKEESEFRGINKTCSDCIDYNRKFETKRYSKEYFDKYRKTSGKDIVEKHDREYQSKKYFILKSKRLTFEQMDTFLSKICDIKGVSKYQISLEINSPVFREKNSYFHNLTILTFSVLKYGTETHKQEFLSLINTFKDE
jgi:hypothetical protein